MNTGQLNRYWAEAIIDACVQAGVRSIGIAPGSRSTALTLAAANHPHLLCHVHFDERGLGFWALGMAKATQSPVAVITTSGTATANLLPAVMEAHADHVPLIILTADRPEYLIGTGANQTTIQPHLYAAFVAAKLNMDTPDIAKLPQVSEHCWARIQSGIANQLPVHLNIPFDEPLYDATPVPDIPQWKALAIPRPPAPDGLSSLAQKLSSYRSGVIIAGQLRNPSDSAAVLDLATALGWPIFPDILSGLRLTKHPNTVCYPDTLLLLDSGFPKPEVALWIGHPVLSKSVLNWLNIADFPVIRWTEFSLKDVPSITHFSSVAVPYSLIPSVIRQLKGSHHPLNLPTPVVPSLAPEMTEIWIGQHLLDLVPDHSVLFIGNSLPIRLLNQNLPHTPKPLTIHANRGVSGIDGLISSAIGTVMGHQKPGVAFIGDLSALYDLNGLAQLPQCPYPLRIIILNNDGGGIFQHLPVATQSSHFERFFKTPHGLAFKSAADLFKLPYTVIKTLDEWQIAKSLPLTQHEIIELIPSVV